ncbi:MAG: TIGR01440 family protein [Vulcanibacillus sp.]
MDKAINELLGFFPLNNKDILVIGASTSEVLGGKIGTMGNEEIAKDIFEKLVQFQKSHHFQLAFQSCEHINRALIVERTTAEEFKLEIVSVVPVLEAGGAMATYAYKHLVDPVAVEFIKADAGIDIGDTFIGMHLKHVAVPVRASIRNIGQAHLTMAITRPKLIGGERACYKIK